MKRQAFISKAGVWVMLWGVLMGAGFGRLSAASDSNNVPLSGRVESSQKKLLAGIPVRAATAQRGVSFTVFTNRKGAYLYRQLPPGTYILSIEAAGFQPVKKETVQITAGKPTQVDFTLETKPISLADITTAELLAALPGNDKQKAEASGCSNCHSLQFVLQAPRRDQAGWLRTVERMRGIMPNRQMQSEDRVKEILNHTRKANELLSAYLVTVNGPDSTPVTFRTMDLPSDEAYSRVQITEYAIPRGQKAVQFRGDPEGAWLHDLLLDSKNGYIWYTDHFANVLGRLNPKTGEIKEFPYPLSRPGRLAGAHKLASDKDGNIWMAAIWQGAIVRFDPKTEKFDAWLVPDFEPDGRLSMVVADSLGNAWASSNSGNVYKLDPQTGKIIRYANPLPNRSIYGMTIDSKDVLYLCHMNVGKVGTFDPKTAKFREWDTSSPDSFPRREEMDAQDRFWFTMSDAGKIGMLDPKTEKVREWKLSSHPYTSPYDVAVDDRNSAVWTTDFNSNRIFRFDMKTEKTTEFLLPSPDIEIRNLIVDSSTSPPTIWIPDYSPPGRIFKFQAW